MYNGKRKQEFIEQYSKSPILRRVCEYLFETLEPIEAGHRKDICEFSPNEYADAIEKVNEVNTHRRYQRVVILRNYVNWCCINGVPNANRQFMEYGLDKFDRSGGRYVNGPIQLANIMDAVLPPVSYETKDITVRAYCWLVFAGIRPTDAVKVKQNDVDLKHATIHFEDHEYPIYRQAIPAFEKCISLHQIAYRSSEDEYERCYRDRHDGDELLRGVYSLPTYQSFGTDVSRMVSKYNKSVGDEMRLTVSRIWLSGVFYRTHELEMSGIEPSFTQVAIEQVVDISERWKVELKTGEHRRILTTKNTLMREYSQWKLEFNIL